MIAFLVSYIAKRFLFVLESGLQIRKVYNFIANWTNEGVWTKHI